RHTRSTRDWSSDVCSSDLDEPLLFRLRDAQLVVGVLDVSGQLVPGRRLLLGRADEVLDVIEIDARQVRAPVGQRLAPEQLEALQIGRASCREGGERWVGRR